MRILLSFFLCLGAACQSLQRKSEELVSVSTGAKNSEGEADSSALDEDSKEQRAILSFLLAEQARYSGQRRLANNLYKSSYDYFPGATLAEKILLTQEEGASDSLFLAKKMALTYPKSTSLRLILARELIKTQEYDNAKEECRKIITLEPENVEAHNILIAIFLTEGDYDSALKLAEKMTVRFANDPRPSSISAQIYLKKKNFKKALEQAQRAYELQSDNEENALWYAHLLDLNHKDKSAILIYSQVFNRSPKSDDFILRTAILYRVFGRLESVLEKIDHLLARNLPDPEPWQLQRIYVLWELKRDQEALLSLKAMQEKRPSVALINYMLGLCYEKMANPDLAYQAFAQVILESDYYFYARYRMITILQSAKRLNDALNLALELMQNRYAGWECYVISAGLYSDLLQPEKAIALLVEGYQKYPQKTQLLFLQGVYKERLGDVDGCIETMLLVIEKDQTFSSAYNYLGYLYAQRNENLDTALNLVLKAIELKPQDGYYIDSLGFIYYQKGQFSQAVDLFLEALKLAPEEGIIYDHLGDALLKLQQKDNAIKAFEKALELKLEDEDRDAIQKKLEKIRS